MMCASRARLLLLLIVAWIGGTGGCASTRPQLQPRGDVIHVVVCWLKTPGDEAARRKLIDASRSFGSIPGVVNVETGRAIFSDRPVVDDSFDVAVVLIFRDEAALRAYNDHPAHKQAVEETLKPLVGKMVIYDFVDQ